MTLSSQGRWRIKTALGAKASLCTLFGAFLCSNAVIFSRKLFWTGQLGNMIDTKILHEFLASAIKGWFTYTIGLSFDIN